MIIELCVERERERWLNGGREIMVGGVYIGNATRNGREIYLILLQNQLKSHSMTPATLINVTAPL